MEAGRVEHLFLLGGTRQPPELGDQLADRPLPAVVLVVRDVSGDQAFKVLGRIPVG